MLPRHFYNPQHNIHRRRREDIHNAPDGNAIQCQTQAGRREKVDQTVTRTRVQAQVMYQR